MIICYYIISFIININYNFIYKFIYINISNYNHSLQTKRASGATENNDHLTYISISKLDLVTGFSMHSK